MCAIYALRGAPVDITLIDRHNYHLFQPLLYQLGTCALSESDIAWPIRHLVAKRRDVTTLLGEVSGVDKEKKEVFLRDGKSLPYDSLILATGSQDTYFGHDQWRLPAPGLKSLMDATTVRRRFLLAFELAERETDLDRRKSRMTIIVVGGGPTGVELAGAIAQMAHRTLPNEFRNIDTRHARVVLIEAGPCILSTFKPDLSEYARNALQDLGVEVLTAKQMGTFVGKLLRDRVNGEEEKKAFKYTNMGNLATIGKNKAVADFGFIQFKGAFAWWLWGIAHIYFLIGSRNRLVVALNWLYYYLLNVRSSRVISQNPFPDFPQNLAKRVEAEKRADAKKKAEPSTNPE
ncbi:hypothetical protein MSPP1_003042, partial [Malassezia sp. CBS 17886]